MTGENWNEVLYDGIRSKGGAAAAYFLFLYIVCNYIILNLFVAILISCFADTDDEETKAKRDAVRLHAPPCF